jgi:hypothetical protein
MVVERAVEKPWESAHKVDEPNISANDCGLASLKRSFYDLAAKIAAKYGNKRVGEKTVIKLLMERTCERFIVEELKTGAMGDEEVDRIWRNLHDYAASLLIEKLKNELASKEIPVSIVREADNPSGRYDVLIFNGVTPKILNGDGKICLELKVGFNVSLEQIEKYLWDSNRIILARFAAGDVVTLRAEDWEDFLKAVLEERLKKAERIYGGKVVLVPGDECLDCPLRECRFNRNNGANRGIRGPKSLTNLLETFRRNAISTIDAAVKSVLEELTTNLSHAKSEGSSNAQ